MKGIKMELYGSVKILLSYDYCNFEINIGSSTPVDLNQIDEMRKNAQRLADKAVKQYIKKKEIENEKIKHEMDAGMDAGIEREIKIIKENFPQSEWTPEQKAKIKIYDEYIFWKNREYDYEDNPFF